MRKLLNAQQLADYLGIETTTLYKWNCEGSIPCVKISKKTVRYDIDAINEWLKTKEIKGSRKKKL